MIRALEVDDAVVTPSGRTAIVRAIGRDGRVELSYFGRGLRAEQEINQVSLPSQLLKYLLPDGRTCPVSLKRLEER